MSAGRWHDRVQMLKLAQSRGTPALGQLLAARWAASPAFARHLQRMRQKLKAQREQTAHALARHFPPGTRLRLPPGGLNLWVELPEGVSSMRLFERALEEGIRIAPGTMFSNTDRYDRFVRFGCTLPFTQAVEDAYRTLGHLAREMLAA
jgi:DNA-binding transcriptional MocR family regulator